jgi:preprotein translocase subunit SecD
MGKNLAGRTGFIVAILVIFIYGIFFGSNLPKRASLKTLLTDNIHLGLDLQGGTHMVLQVHVEEAVNSTTDRDLQRLNTALAATGATASKVDLQHPEVITVKGGSTTQQSAIDNILTGNDYANYDVSSASGGGYAMTLKQAAIRDIKDRTLETSIGTIRERIDKLGTIEPVIEKYGLGDNEIVLELPGISDPAEVQRLIQATPKLEIHPVVGNSGYPDLASATAAAAVAGGVVPPDEEIASGTTVSGGAKEFYVLKRAAVVEGSDFRDAQPAQDENGRPELSFNLTTDAGDRFFTYTGANKGNMMAITLNDEVISAATIQNAIRDSGRITGSFTEDYVAQLATKLRSGSLPASIAPIETRTVGASLGADSIHEGVVAAIAGLVVVMIFMLIYYRGAGINADLALVLNLLILLGFMAFSGATLSLPGIAGVILTIGMGVDSNVLIFERVREELRLGKTAAAAIQDGFAHAWTTILDTHVTTVVSAVILFLLGTGPVRGFATTLTIGLLANVFTAVFVSRTIFEYLLSKKARGTAELSI